MTRDGAAARRPRLPRWLGSPRLSWIAALVAALLALPSVATGLQTEDFVHRAIVRSGRSWLQPLFGVPDGTILTTYRAKDAGLLPWITAQDWHVSFWRPVAVLTHSLDYKLWPEQPWLMHAHSLIWLGLLAYVSSRLFRRLLEPPTYAGLATVLYAVCDGHGPVVGWLANRNAIIASVFGVLAIELHDRWRRDGQRVGAVLAPLSLWLGLAAGEIAVGAVGYLIAHALLVDRAALGRRALALVPALLAFLGWAIPYRRLGYGAHGSGAYIDPLLQPLEFARAAATRFPTLSFGLLGWPPIDLLALLDAPWPERLFPWALGFLVVVGLALVPLLRGSGRARFWALGAALAVLPGCGTFPADRLLLLSGLGGTALIAELIGNVAERSASLPSSWPARAACAALAGFWLITRAVVAPLCLPVRATGLAYYNDWVVAAGDQILAGGVAQRQLVVIVNAPDFYTGTLISGTRSARGLPVPSRMQVLYGGPDPIGVERRDAFTLVVRTRAGFLRASGNQVYRPRWAPLRAGDGIQLTGMLVIVEAVDAEGSPTSVAFHFSRSLDTDAQRLVAWNGERYAPLALDVGETRELPPARPSAPGWVRRHASGS